MDLRSLRYYLAAVETGSITAAAEHCFVAQPSISLALGKLEEELGVMLLERGKKGVTPTAAGRELYLKAQRLLAESDGIVRYFRQQTSLPTISLQLDVALSLSRMRRLLKQLTPLRQSYQLEISQANPEARIRISRRDELPENFHFQPLWEDEYCLLLPLEHPLAYKMDISVQDLQQLAIIERTFCERSQLWEEFISGHQLAPRITAQTDTEDWALMLVEAGVGATIAPAPDDLDNYLIKAVPLSSIAGLGRITRVLGLAWSPFLPEKVQSTLEAFKTF